MPVRPVSRRTLFGVHFRPPLVAIAAIPSLSPDRRTRLRHRHTHRSESCCRRKKLADRKSTRLNSSHLGISYAVFCLKKKKSAGSPGREPRMTLLLGSLTIGSILALLALGVFVSFRVFHFPDITTEGSFTLGASITLALLVGGVSAPIATAAGAGGGLLAGAATGVLHTRFRKIGR